jgi:hypothetical protein
MASDARSLADPVSGVNLRLADAEASFARHLRAENRAQGTILTYLKAIRQLDAFLAGQGMPRHVLAIRRAQ